MTFKKKKRSKSIAVVMITLNESHNIKEVYENIKDWADEIFIVDSYSKDNTVDIALDCNINIVQRKFRGFGDQWNFALRELPIKSDWVMKLDPDERISSDLKQSIDKSITNNNYDGFSFDRRLWFMGKPMPVFQNVTRVWKNGICNFTDVLVNEHPIINGEVTHIDGYLEHYDSPDLDHWLEKQNRYTTSEAIISHKKLSIADKPVFFGTFLQRRMWIKSVFYKVPFRYFFLFMYHWLFQSAYKAGKVGFIWSKLRVQVKRMVEYKAYEMSISNKTPSSKYYGASKFTDKRIKNYK
jgi:glycosyltransferase involved in cell wall biosynthesis